MKYFSNQLSRDREREISFNKILLGFEYIYFILILTFCWQRKVPVSTVWNLLKVAEKLV